MSCLQICALVYLYLPILLFLLLWIRPVIAIPAVLVIGLCVYFALRKGGKDGTGELSDRATQNGMGKKLLPGLILSGIILLCWCVFSGIGGYTRQSLDWEKHNFILRMLTEKPWPVLCEVNGEQGMLVYYIAGYLVPALFGKISGSFQVSEFGMLVWTFAGLLLVLLVLCRYLQLKRARDAVILCLTIVLFSTFLTPVSGIYENLVPGDHGTGEQWYWLSTSYPAQFSSNMMLLRWVSPQAVSGWLLTAALLTERKTAENWGLLLIPAVLYSTFVFAGLAVLMLFFITEDFLFVSGQNRSGLVKRILDIRNLCSLLPMAVLILFILSSVVQEKPGYSGMAFTLMRYRGKGILTFLCLNLTWILWVLLLGKREGKNTDLWAAALLLLLLSLIRMGDWNDLCMRASIPALFLLCVLTARQLTDCKAGRWYRMLLMTALCLCAVSSLHELITGFHLYGLHPGNGYPAPATAEAFIGDSLQHRYQYFNWNLNGILHILTGGV